MNKTQGIVRFLTPTIVIWLVLWLITVYIEFGTVYIICSSLYFMWTTMSNSERKGPSAYSVFNKGCKKLPGTFNPSLDDFLRPSNRSEKEEDMWTPEETTNPTKKFTGKAKPNQKCPCGSGVKYKKCCGKPVNPNLDDYLNYSDEDSEN
eukprot:TRINITY_DN7420_c0_g1_i1.p1 TRINITY_DN7420_c0_g1~~TRINITY_DN7420_c0_g1_i1.p1  ORF type:complete len:149 (-),score=6.57 TRINITY_DN7420_c0_g1_i1:64-510(-)